MDPSYEYNSKCFEFKGAKLAGEALFSGGLCESMGRQKKVHFRYHNAGLYQPPSLTTIFKVIIYKNDKQCYAAI